MNSVTMDNLGILISIGSIVVSSLFSAWLVYLKMDAKLEKILARDYIGVLNKAQAVALLGLYLSEIKRELNREIDALCDKRPPLILNDTDEDSVSIRLRNTIRKKFPNDATECIQQIF